MVDDDGVRSTEPSGEAIGAEVEKALDTGSLPAATRFLLSCVGGAIPLVGGVLSGAAGAWSENDQSYFNRLFAHWLKLHEAEIKEIGITIAEIMMRVNTADEEVRKRIESPEYMSLLRKAFRDWSAAESEEKRVLIRNLLCHAANDRFCDDDVVRLFIKWIADYSELHFKVIKYVYQNEGSTRAQMWSGLKGTEVREDSAEADLFKLLIHDLSVGHVIRQHRETDGYGKFLKLPQRTPRGRDSSRTITSAFEDGKPYELTELGKQFVFYTMQEIIPKLTSS